MGIRKLFKILLIIFFIHATLSTEIVEKIEVSSKALFEKMVSKNMIVIDKEFINKFGIQKISDIFRFIPGVHISRRGNGDTSYDISMRGGNFEQVQILINGIPFNNPQTGHFNTDLPISVENIERIEIARGSSSVSHGPGGSAGKINIILKEYQGIMVNLTGGDKSLAGAGLGFGEKFGNIKFEVNADTISSKGYYDGQEYNNQQLSSTLSYRSAMTSFIFNAGYLTKQFGAKDFYAPFPSKEKIDTGNFNFNYKMSGKIEHEFNFSMIIHNDDFVLDRYDKDFFRSGSKTLRKYIKYQNYFSIGDLAFSTGADLDHLQIKSSVIGEHSRKRGGLFFNTGIKKDNWGIDVGVRWNVENNISPKTSFYSGIYTVFKHNIILRGSYAVSLRYPTFTELYYKSPANIGNEELYPEKSENFEVSLDLPLKYFKAGLNLFARKQYQMIDWIKEDYRSPWRAVNSDDNDVFGYEISLLFNDKVSAINGAYERIIVPGYETKYISKYGYRFPDKKVTVNIKRNLSLNLDLILNNTYKRILETKETAYLTDMIIRWKRKSVQISLIVENIFNSVIEEIPGVRIPGRWLWLSLKYQK